MRKRNTGATHQILCTHVGKHDCNLWKEIRNRLAFKVPIVVITMKESPELVFVTEAESILGHLWLRSLQNAFLDILGEQGLYNSGRSRRCKHYFLLTARNHEVVESENKRSKHKYESDGSCKQDGLITHELIFVLGRRIHGQSVIAELKIFQFGSAREPCKFGKVGSVLKITKLG